MDPMSACQLVLAKLSGSPQFWSAFAEALSDAIVDSVAVVAFIAAVAVIILKLARKDRLGAKEG